ncbi:hypothetical protein L596_002654 [Steinernema carpocapsae]|uniref:Uncharacterized protein n=1 Tax=Steinernema carpocapsae TaxID=34508 RepID=A0A4V6I7S5_STECR|nr:hypothetical protein L596_002654 [Steinernema carpocapsae]
MWTVMWLQAFPEYVDKYKSVFVLFFLSTRHNVGQFPRQFLTDANTHTDSCGDSTTVISNGTINTGPVGQTSGQSHLFLWNFSVFLLWQSQCMVKFKSTRDSSKSNAMKVQSDHKFQTDRRTDRWTATACKRKWRRYRVPPLTNQGAT